MNENIERVAKYSARLAQLRQRRSALEEALAAADAEAGLPSRQGEMDLFDDAGGWRRCTHVCCCGVVNFLGKRCRVKISNKIKKPIRITTN